MSANKDRLALIEHLSSIGGEHSDDLRETLDRAAFAIASGMEAEVCSLYLFDPQRERIVLRATVGLDRESVGKVSMRLNEGLVGLVLETGRAGVTCPTRSAIRATSIFPRPARSASILFSACRCMTGARSRSACWSRRRSSGANSTRAKSGCSAPPPTRSRRFFLISGCANRSRPRKKSGSNTSAA